MSLEGVYRWITFLPSKVKEGRPNATTYFGVFRDGEVKVRGLACRRSDTPEFIRRVQLELLAVIAAADTLAERARLEGRALALLRGRIEELRRGEVPARLLAVSRTLTREPDAYRVVTRVATAAAQLAEEGVKLHPGERVRYVITEAGADDPARRVREGEVRPRRVYDAEEYVRLLKVAAAEVLTGLRPGASGSELSAQCRLPFP